MLYIQKFEFKYLCADNAMYPSKQLELALSVALAHTFAAAAATLDGAKDSINIRGSAPFLMCEHINTELLLPSLNEIYVRQHALIFEGPRELGCYSCCGV